MPSNSGSRVTLALLLLFTTTSLSAPAKDVCASISNPDCRCSNSSSSSASSTASSRPPPDIRCVLVSKPPSPLFSSQSAPGPVGTLDLSGNQLHDLPAAFFPRGLAVGRLVLSDNNLTRVPSAVWGLAALTSLDMSGNQLTSLSPDAEASNDTQLGLKELNLSRNLISSVDSQVFAATTRLTSLDLSHNRLSEVTDIMFSRLELSLVALDVSYNALRAIKGLALQHLQHLRRLSLARNPLTDLTDVQFPQHLRSLDLSHCALTIIDHCQLSGLPDLSFIGLAGNDLQCTCQLYLLLQWYQDQNHEVGNADASSMGTNWTCTTSGTSTPAALTRPAGSHDVTTDAPSGGERRVTELTYCQDTETHCQTLEHWAHHVKGSSQIVISLDVASTDDTIMASWTFEENGEVVVDGFRLRYIPEDAQPMTSPVIPADQRSYVLRDLGLEEHFRVCLDVLSFETAVVHMECRSFKDESGSIVVGILAGVIFLVPCITAMLYVLYKDRQFTRDDEECQPLQGGEKDAEMQNVAENDHCAFKIAGSAPDETDRKRKGEKFQAAEASDAITAPSNGRIQFTGSREAAAPAEKAPCAADGPRGGDRSPPASQSQLSTQAQGPLHPPPALGVDNVGFIACDGGECRAPHDESTNL